MAELVLYEHWFFVRSLWNGQKNVAKFPTISQSPIVTTSSQEIEDLVVFGSRVTFE